MKRSPLVLGSAVATVMVVGMGCASPLPHYAWRDPTTAIRTMSQRDAAIRTFSAACRLLLESDAGRIELTAALVAQPPHRLRLRAWKLSQAVFDITLNENGLFVLDKRRSSRAGEQLGHINYARFVEAIALLPGFDADVAWRNRTDANDDEFTITRPRLQPGSTIECVVDRNTLVRKRCVYRDDSGQVRQSLTFEEYASLGETVWPMRIAGEGESGSFVLSFDRVDVNGELAPRAFDPPRRAVKQP